MYDKSVDILLNKAAEIEAKASAIRSPDQVAEASELEQQAMNLRQAAETLKVTEPGDNSGSLTVAMSILQGGIGELHRTTGTVAYGIVAVPLEAVGDDDGPYTQQRDQLLSVGATDPSLTHFLHTIYASKSLPHPSQRDVNSHSELLRYFQRLVMNVLYQNSPPSAEDYQAAGETPPASND